MRLFPGRSSGHLCTGKVRNVHLGNCGKMKDETTKQEAKAMKAAALAIKI
jgi:hypothetical protein